MTSAGSSSGNEEQIQFWNAEAGRRWVAGQEALDRAMEPFAQAVVHRAALRDGERVLDVGCGCGATTLLLGDAVSPSGSVVGVDVSEVMLAAAVERARGRPNLSFQVADATVFEPQSLVDVVASRFGVMFFSDPVRSFSNLRRVLRPGGRVTFVCWRAPQENPWMSLPVQAALTVLPQPAPLPPEAPGPFSFAARERIQRILGAAEFVDVSIEPFDTDVVVATAAGGLEEATRFALTLGPTSRLLEGIDEVQRAHVEAVVREALKPYVTSVGVFLKGATWLVSARRS